jgi:hypothetical protein
MSQPGDSSDEDGLIYRQALRRAEDVDRAQDPAQRRRAWARLMPVALLALAEGWARDSFRAAAVVCSVVVIVIGVASGALAATVGYIVAGVLGIMLVLTALIRRWSAGRQWAVIVAMLVLQCSLMVTA